ncbi:amylase-binding adhesin AbpA [Streptococcus sp. V869]
MKKVLLSSVAALAVFSVAAPAFADINGGANTPGAYDQPVTGGGVNDAYNAQTEFVNGRKANEYVGGHQDNVDAIASQDPAVVEAKKAFDAVEGGSHLYGEKKAAYENALNDARNAVRNAKIQESQNTYNTANKKEGRYYILNETPEQANARYLKEHGLSAQASADQAAADQAATKPEDGKPGAVDQAKKADAAAKKAGASAKAAKKALPKTHAAK